MKTLKSQLRPKLQMYLQFRINVRSQLIQVYCVNESTMPEQTKKRKLDGKTNKTKYQALKDVDNAKEMKIKITSLLNATHMENRGIL